MVLGMVGGTVSDTSVFNACLCVLNWKPVYDGLNLLIPVAP